MAEDLITSLYPPPPPYYKYFTAANVLRWQELQEKAENGRPDDGILSLPENAELRLQVPPPIPTQDQYRGYGSVWSLENKLPSLKELGWKQLYEAEDETITSKAKIEELHKLLDSLLLNFLELVATMSVEPAKFHFKIEHLKLILINMNHLLNTYRPHQTRESLIMLLQTQIDDKRAEIDAMDRVVAEIKEKIGGLVGDCVESKEESVVQEDERLEKLKELLAATAK